MKRIIEEPNKLKQLNGADPSAFMLAGAVDKLSEETELTKIKWADLKALRDNGQLVPGKQYRIIDYQCTTAQENTQSAWHQFDIIVVADDEKTLNENARAIQHESDTYFADCNLSAWELKYSIDNDTNRFAWADEENGKGIIFYMKDDLENECHYDFKNIMFELKKLSSISWTTGIDTDMQDSYDEEFVGHYVGDWFTVNNAGDVTLSDTDTKYFYTFSLNPEEGDDSGTIVDGSRKGSNESDEANIYRSNVIPEYIEPDSDNTYKLNYIVFKPFTDTADDCCCNVFGKNNHSIVLDFSLSVYNTFGNECYSNTFGNNCNYNSFGNSCLGNTFGNNYYRNTFGNNCSSNTFGNECSSNTFGNECYSNTFGNECYSNTFGNSCLCNTFGNECYSNTFGNKCKNNTFGNNCYYNTFGNNCNYNSFGNECSSNTFGNNVHNLNFNTNYSDGNIQYINVLNGFGYNAVTAVPTGIATGVSYSQNAGFKTDGTFIVKNIMD